MCRKRNRLRGKKRKDTGCDECDRGSTNGSIALRNRLKEKKRKGTGYDERDRGTANERNAVSSPCSVNRTILKVA